MRKVHACKHACTHGTCVCGDVGTHAHACELPFLVSTWNQSSICKHKPLEDITNEDEAWWAKVDDT